MLDSLVRVSRRGDKRHFVRVLHHHDGKNDPYRFISLSRAGKEAWLVTDTSTRHRHCLPSVPFQQFQVLFNSLFKVLCIFPSRYLFAIGLPPIFSFRRNLPPSLSCNPKQLDSSKAGLTHAEVEVKTGFSPSMMPCSKGLNLNPRLATASIDYNSVASRRSHRFSI